MPSRRPLAYRLLLVLAPALAALLAAFPLEDPDIWWHLRTGRLIRETGAVPRTDPYTFTVPDHPWIDLHWAYQVALNWGYERIGFVGLDLLKCGLIAAAFALLLGSAARDRPAWPMALAWLPSLLLWSWRMTLRPETVSMALLCATLAIVDAWDRRPRLAWFLPLVMLTWVNVQGLFVLGLGVIGLGLVDAALTCRSIDRPRGWWLHVLPAGLLAGLACLANPYGLEGVLYPETLASTLAHAEFLTNIAEFTPLTLFIERTDGRHVMFGAYVATWLVALVSFAAPLAWRWASGSTWRIRPFRVLLVVAFGALSTSAVRNMVPFAIVAGAVSAWNLGDWAAARRPGRAGSPNWLVVGVFVAALAVVSTGSVHRAADRGRRLGLGERPDVFAHEAARFAGSPGMPDRFLGYPLDTAGLFEFYHAPDRKVFADPRLEVMGVDLFREYLALEMQLAVGGPHWSEGLERLGRPSILIRHDEELPYQGRRFHPGAGVMAHPDWRCVHFDDLAAVFVHRSIDVPAVDFAARHFGTDRPSLPPDRDRLLSLTRGLSAYVFSLQARRRPDLAWTLALVGLDLARTLRADAPDDPAAWSLVAAFDLNRDPEFNRPPAGPPDRPFDPTAELFVARGLHALRKAATPDSPDRAAALDGLIELATAQNCLDAALARLDERITLEPDPPRSLLAKRAALARRLASTPPSADVPALLASGRSLAAADRLEAQFRESGRPWSIAERLGPLLLRLGEPARARAIWSRAADPPDEKSRSARLAVTFHAGDNLPDARAAYLAARPEDAASALGLARLEADAGDAEAARSAAIRADRHATDDATRRAASSLLARPGIAPAEPAADAQRLPE